jgi:hypothetical protein
MSYPIFAPASTVTELLLAGRGNLTSGRFAQVFPFFSVFICQKFDLKEFSCVIMILFNNPLFTSSGNLRMTFGNWM